MSEKTAGHQWVNDIIAQNKQAAPGAGPVFLNEMREHARRSLGRLALPNRKQEAWRYSNPDDLFSQSYRYQDAPFTALDEGDIEEWIYPAGESHRLVFANGRFVPALSAIHALPDNVRLGSLQAMLVAEPAMIAKWLEQPAWYNTDVFNELNRALLNDGLFIHVPEHAVVDKPIEVVYLNLGLEEQALCQPRSLVILEAGARAELVERFTSTGDSPYFFNGMTDVFLGEHAGLRHYRLQNESAQARHLSRVALQQDAASEYSGINIAAGGAWSRTDIHSRFNGSHATCELDGLYVVAERQYMDFHLDVRHSLPGCRSRENFRGIVYGKGRAVFDGRILVEKNAQKTDARLSNKNLLLSHDAEVDTKPQLEIYADDVKCSHGATVGRIDPNQLFYLRSRGIAGHTARKMLCLGFAEQILARVDEKAVHDFIHSQLSEIFAWQEGNVL